MQRIINYGSFLQAYALKKVLESQNHIVDFIDIEDGEYHEALEKNRVSLKGRLKIYKKHMIRWLKYRTINSKIEQIIKEKQRTVLGLLDEKMKIHKDCEAVVIGSDEVFNCAPTSSWGISTQMFGNIDVPIVISYAASCGYTRYCDIPEEWQKKLGHMLKKMKSVSVRDKNTFEFVNRISKIEPAYHIDPVLLYDFEREIEKAKEHMEFEQPYMIIYAYANRINEATEINAIKKFAQERKLKMLCVGGMLTWCDDYPAWNPFEVLVGFKHAKYIVTDTFHGTVISAKFNKPFAVLVRESNANKLNDILERFNLEKHCINQIDDLDKILTMDLDYSEFNSKICNAKKASKEYFIRNL